MLASVACPQSCLLVLMESVPLQRNLQHLGWIKAECAMHTNAHQPAHLCIGQVCLAHKRSDLQAYHLHTFKSKAFERVHAGVQC